jgi:tRNA modification GTPase
MSLDISCRDTICALSSAQGPSAIALVRASGPRALDIFSQLFKTPAKLKAFKALHGTIYDNYQVPIDDCMAVFYDNNRGFTGESSFEIHCHGNAIIIDEILKAMCALGARLAEPGEFSMRALLNHKIDLAQAESIADLIHAQSSAAKNAALKGVQGGLQTHCAPIRENILKSLAELEARMDFPDEDLGGYNFSYINDLLGNALDMLNKLLANSSYALKLHEGARVVICGQPNAGKSTLLNCLSQSNRAIVHESAGTTRDVIEAKVTLSGIPVTLVDVAGIREISTASNAHAIEQLGIERAFHELKQAHVIIWLADINLDNYFDDPLIRAQLKELSTPVLYVLNKADSLDKIASPENLIISAKHNLGIADLLAEIHKILLSTEVQTSEIYITRARQRDELQLAQQALQEAIQALREAWADEVITSELRRAGLALDRLFGSELSEDVLDIIFSQFCIGK